LRAGGRPDSQSCRPPLSLEQRFSVSGLAPINARPCSASSETRFSSSFLTRDRRRRTECCCHPVTFAIASIVAPD
jgi:hypothetical protein